MYYSGVRPAERLSSALSVSYDPVGESSEDHRDRLFLQVLLSLTVNILALLVVFYFLLPLSESGRVSGGLLLWTVLGITVGIMAIFLKFGGRVVCVNLLLLVLSGVLFGASFILGGVMSPTMIFLLAVPVPVLAVLGSYVSATNRLRTVMEQKNERLDYLASYDSLTSIPNRRTFFEHAQRCLQRAARSKNSFALLVIDLNDFKQINDGLGHKVGDAVLLHFAQRLSGGFRDTDSVGRLGGDEFAVLLEPAESLAGVEDVIRRFRMSESNEMEVDGKSVQYDFAVGVAIYPDNGASILDLYEAADAAMYCSKKEVPPAFIWK